MNSTARLPRILAGLILPFAMLMLVGGARLLQFGGSVWYCGTGAVLLLTVFWLWRHSAWAWMVYSGWMLVSVVWALFEVGLDAWGLLPRLLLLMVLWVVVLSVRLGGSTAVALRWRALTRVAALISCVGLTALAVWHTAAISVTSNSVVQETLPAAAELTAPATDQWAFYGNDPAGTRFSGARQITPNNVAQLSLAWQFQTGDLATGELRYNFEATPLKIGRTLYVCSPSGQVFALDARTGAPRWQFKPQVDFTGVSEVICRSVAFHAASGQKSSTTGSCAQRIFVGTPDGWLYALDADSGARCADFGDNGALDLKQDLGEVPAGSYAVTSPPMVLHNLLIVGAKIRDNHSADMPSGVVRAFDATTGALVWAWDMGREQSASPTELGSIYTRSTPNAWAPFTLDEQLGLIYIPTGNPALDFWGGRRRPFDHQYGSSVVALELSSGRVRWHFQVTHHDVWDNDISAQPLLVDVKRGTQTVPMVVIGTKQGQIFVLDRRDGQPVLPVTERAVAQGSDLGEALSPTQPASAIALNPGPSTLQEKDMWGLTPVDQLWCRIQYRRARYQGAYTPPGLAQRAIIYPGMFGGIEWGGMSVDPQRGLLFANVNAMPFMVQLTRRNATEPAPSVSAAPEGTQTTAMTIKDSGLAAAFYGFLSPLKMPCMQPPWGKLYAIDLATGAIRWQRRVGTAADAGPLGVRTRLPILVGTPQAGGTLVTASGLLFAGATLDNYLRAYDSTNGRELWRGRLPAGGQATPMSYEVDGQQFVVIAAGGHAVLGTTGGDYVLAFALRESVATKP